ncbi:bifunctional diaminohydroxyphosphoribosylaminopyrimidine deaminase/5-amino-6-(5-phosphoribosylamino)uracil reductase RibD [Brevibacillus sp. SYSU BS000544]|uniref:bifunctional diaminohydroxyphosphoribosylaminopyrimidine deaminase/5-amino-6-(5-phosphoribosylamino)uracil reductase RibD n=1 Tax=Brevibacillus sp. SYSU BS000544 TaxID=3416443 RepID=UPI003CE5685A
MRDADFMRTAIELAKSTTGQTSPNPMVGAIVVKDGAIVGVGAHLKAGEPHAEVHALRMAGEKAQGATIYVTLEPCSHHGRTPPCVEAIIRAGISQVVVATVDPNPQVAGRGVKMLQEAGLDVRVGVLEAEAHELNEVFFHYITTGKPFVTVKTASTLDGKIATGSGNSKWITGEQAREEVHLMRHRHDAILVGVGTVIQDNPALTARVNEQGRQPVRVILDTHLRIPMTARVITNSEAPTWIITSKNASPERITALTSGHVHVIVLDSEAVTIQAVLQVLGENGITSLFVEGGSAVNGSFLQEKAINKVISYLSMKLVGGALAPTAFGGEGYTTMNEAVRLNKVTVEQVSEMDWRVSGYPVWDNDVL